MSRNARRALGPLREAIDDRDWLLKDLKAAEAADDEHERMHVFDDLKSVERDIEEMLNQWPSLRKEVRYYEPVAWAYEPVADEY